MKAGGDARLAGHAREEVARKAAAAAPKPAPPPEVVAQQEARTAAAAAAAREAKYEAMMREYEQAKGKVNRQRLAAAAAWRASTGTDMQRPPVERGGRCECMRGVSGGNTDAALCRLQHPHRRVWHAARRVQDLGLHHVAPRHRHRQELERHVSAHVPGAPRVPRLQRPCGLAHPV